MLNNILDFADYDNKNILQNILLIIVVAKVLFCVKLSKDILKHFYKTIKIQNNLEKIMDLEIFQPFETITTYTIIT